MSLRAVKDIEMEKARNPIALFFLLAAGLFASAPASARPIQTLPEAESLRLDVNLEISVSDGAFFEPLSLSPDIYYGLSERFVLALTHSAASQGRIGSGRSLRLTGGGNIYQNLGLEVFYRLLSLPSLDVAPQMGLMFDSFDPFRYSFKLGALAHTQVGPIVIVANPNLQLALNESDQRENQVILPFWGYYQFQEGMDFYAYLAIDKFEAVAFGGGAVFQAMESVRLGGQLGWPRLFGERGAFDRAHINLFAQLLL